MLCQKCKSKEATFFYKQNVNGKVTQVHLCADCAKKYGTGGSLSDLFDIDLLGGFFGSPHGLLMQTKTCPKCGSDYRDIINSGKAGCAECYKTFREELSGTVERIHGRVKHIGRSPDKQTGSAVDAPADEAKPVDERSELKKQLDEAIACEDFEQAAVIRDKIRALDENKETEA